MPENNFAAEDSHDEEGKRSDSAVKDGPASVGSGRKSEGEGEGGWGEI